MGLVLGVDVGGSTTKIVGYEGEKLTGTLQVRAADAVTSLYGGIGNFLYQQGRALRDVERIVLTGVGASFVEGDVHGIPTERVEEFVAIGNGGLRLAGVPEALVISMGTGTAFVEATAQGAVHIGGSGVGGGTLVGLASRLIREDDITAILAFAEEGSLGQVDLSIQDISREEIKTLPPDLTAANFGRISPVAAKSDLAAGLVNLILETVGMLGVFAVHGTEFKQIVLTGTLATLPQAKRVFETLSRLHGVEFIIPEHAVFATALGAALERV